MGRLLIFVLLGCVAIRMATGKWPWAWWRVSERSQNEALARNLLDVNRNATRDEIAEAHRRLLVRVHPDHGGSNEAVHQANAARDLLIARIARSEMEIS
jgi:DnaJ homolog subfamily C member 19